MHMLEVGINIVYIRDFLVHEDISTTMVYIQADNRLKTETVNKLAPKITGETALIRHNHLLGIRRIMWSST